MIIKEKRQQLHRYIDVADYRNIEAIYTILENSMTEQHMFSAEDLETFYERRKAYMNGETQNFTVEEAHSLIRNNVGK